MENIAVRVYDFSKSTKNPIAYLENAFNVGYKKNLNTVWQGSFSMPANDPKNADCRPFSFVELYDGGERVELFRILPSEYRKDVNGQIITYQCEQVLATLLDDIMFRYHQTTNLSAADTIDYILSFQSTPHWQVNNIVPTENYSFYFENQNLLRSLLSIRTAYGDNYMWTYDTKTYPWKLNLVPMPSTVTAYIMYQKNLMGVERYIDPGSVVTRIYPVGYGEGINQLTIEEVNDGVPYIDADTIDFYGVISAMFVDKTEQSPQTLMAKALAQLEMVKAPKVSYSISAADLYQITRDPIDRFRDPGIAVKIYDPDLGTFVSRVITVEKTDMTGTPWEINLEISNKREDIIDVQVKNQNRLNISEVYSQGAVNIDSNDYQDNCDPTHPAVVSFYIPEEVVRINKCLLTYQTEKFRAYETGATSNAGSTETSSSNGSHRHRMMAYYNETDKIEVLTSEEENHRHYFYRLEGNPRNFRILTAPEAGTENEGYLSIYTDQPPTQDVYTYDSAGEHIHQVEIPPHVHAINYGIYESSVAASSLSIKVDGTIIPGETSLTGTDIDIVPYLNKDDAGKITRGWHKVEITPNNLARITASVVKQIFVQSRGGGNY